MPNFSKPPPSSRRVSCRIARTRFRHRDRCYCYYYSESLLLPVAITALSFLNKKKINSVDVIVERHLPRGRRTETGVNTETRRSPPCRHVPARDLHDEPPPRRDFGHPRAVRRNSDVETLVKSYLTATVAISSGDFTGRTGVGGSMTLLKYCGGI